MTKRFTATVKQKEHKPGQWNGQIVEIFDNGVKCGEYEYGYSSGSAKIFQPFEQDGQWYATYADRDYTRLKIMTLPDCKFHCAVADWYQFCPAECYIPKFITASDRINITKGHWPKDIDPVTKKFTRDYWWLNEDKTDSRIIKEDYYYHDAKDLFEDDSDEFKNFSFDNEDHVKKAIDIITKASKHDDSLDFTISTELQYTPVVFIIGCVWACPYEMRAVDLSDLKNKKDQELDYMLITDNEDDSEFIPKEMEKRIKIYHSGGFGIIHEEFKSYEDLKKETEEWKARWAEHERKQKEEKRTKSIFSKFLKAK